MSQDSRSPCTTCHDTDTLMNQDTNEVPRPVPDETSPLLGNTDGTALSPDLERLHSQNLRYRPGLERQDTQQLFCETLDFPEGGLRAWSVVFGCWCAMIAAFGLLNSIGVMHSWLATHQLKDQTYSKIGWIFGTFTFLVYFGSVQIGT